MSTSTTEPTEVDFDFENMTFGVKAPDDTDTGGGGHGGYIHYFNKDGEYRLRFLEEWEDWTSFWDHYDQDKKTSYPCTGDRNRCPGCTSENEKTRKAGKKFLVNCLVQDGEGAGYVHLYKIPGGLKEDIERHREKTGTLIDRDYTIIRYESKGRTNYSIDREDKEPLDLSAQPKQDHQVELRNSFKEAWDPEAVAAKNKRIEDAKAKKDDKVKAEGKAQDAADEAADKAPDEPVPYELLPKEERDKIDAAKAKSEHPGGMEEFATNAPEPEAKLKPKMALEPEPEEEVKLTVSGIRASSVAELKKLYRMAGFDLPDTEDQSELAEKFIDLLS